MKINNFTKILLTILLFVKNISESQNLASFLYTHHITCPHDASVKLNPTISKKTLQLN